jgi:hypothetical protein
MEGQERLMDSKKKGYAFRLLAGVALLLALCSLGSATDLTFETMFPQCVARNVTDSFENSLRCGCYFLIPNLHFETLWNLVINAFSDSLLKTGTYVLDTIWNGFILNPQVWTNLWDDISHATFTRTWNTILEVLKLPFIAPFILFYGIFSSVFVYLLLMTFEFVKTYLVIAVSWSLWSEIVFKEIKGGNKLFSPTFMALVISAILIIGSVLLLAFDVTIWSNIG